MSQSSRRAWLRGAVPLGAAGLVQVAKAAESRKPRGGRRLLYNYDGWGPFLNGLSLDQLDRNVDQFDDTAVTTIMFSPNVGQLPLECTPTAPAVARLRVGERSGASRRMVLRIEALNLPSDARVAVQVNGRVKTKGAPAPYPRLFEESRDAMPPDARNCVDFALAPEDVRFGENEVVVMSSAAIQVLSIELAVMTG